LTWGRTSFSPAEADLVALVTAPSEVCLLKREAWDADGAPLFGVVAADWCPMSATS